MKSTDEMAREIRFRQRELAALDPGRRRTLFTAEVERIICNGVPDSEKSTLIERLIEHFPVGSNPGGHEPLPAFEKPRTTSCEDLISALSAQIAAQPEDERAAFRENIARQLGLEPPRAASVPAAGGGTLTAALEELKEAMLKSPDLALNDGSGAFCKGDITDVESLANTLSKQQKPVGLSRYLWEEKLSRETRDRLSRLLVSPVKSDPNSEPCCRCREALAEDFSYLLAEESIYSEQRFAGVNLSGETRRLLEAGKKEYLSGRTLVRLNQALLEDAYPGAIKCQTTERELVERTIKCLLDRGLSERPVSAQAALRLAAVSLIEIGCLEQLARVTLLALYEKVFDPVYGHVRLGERNEMGPFLAQFVQDGDTGALTRNVRYFSGLMKCLLLWYSFTPNRAAVALSLLDPAEFERRCRRGAAVDYERAFNQFKEAYNRALRDELEIPRQIENLEKGIKKFVEEKVVTDFLSKYE